MLPQLQQPLDCCRLLSRWRALPAFKKRKNVQIRNASLGCSSSPPRWLVDGISKSSPPLKNKFLFHIEMIVPCVSSLLLLFFTTFHFLLFRILQMRRCSYAQTWRMFFSSTCFFLRYLNSCIPHSLCSIQIIEFVRIVTTFNEISRIFLI